jgi:hypothetical protein
LAAAISVGIDNYKSLADTKQPPLLVRDYTRKIRDNFAAEEAKPQSTDPGTPAAPDAVPAPASPRTTLDLTRAPIVP